MVAVVNGYVCFTGCDVEKAKQGKDPNAKPGEEFLDADSKNKERFRRPARHRPRGHAGGFCRRGQRHVGLCDRQQ
jgi:hypothetical protein